MANTNENEAKHHDKTTMEIPPQLQPLVDGMKRLYNYDDFTDLEIVCRGQVWKVHKFCLCAQSAFFQAACGGPFWEAGENKITLDDENPQVIDAFIYFFYHFDYSACVPSGFSPMLLDVRMYVTADKYFVTPLKDLAAKKFDEGAKDWWNTRAFADAIAEVYQTTAAGERNPLKTSVISVVTLHAKDLFSPSSGNRVILEVLAEIAEFGKDVSVALVTRQDVPVEGRTGKTPRGKSSS